MTLNYIYAKRVRNVTPSFNFIDNLISTSLKENYTNSNYNHIRIPPETVFTSNPFF